ncbi:adenine phosphoribosyltransferase [Thalassiella azotivora]
MSATSPAAGARSVEQVLLSHLRDVPDHPSPGVVFKDITPLLADGPALASAVEALSGLVPDDTELVAGVEARGFILGTPVALAHGTGFVPVRKVGKLPGQTIRGAYDLEYGSAEIEVHADAFVAGQRVVVVDDVLATGGTAAAACELVERAGGEVVAVVFLLELVSLEGRKRLHGRRVDAVISV